MILPWSVGVLTTTICIPSCMYTRRTHPPQVEHRGGETLHDFLEFRTKHLQANIFSINNHQKHCGTSFGIPAHFMHTYMHQHLTYVAHKGPKQRYAEVCSEVESSSCQKVDRISVWERENDDKMLYAT